MITVNPLPESYSWKGKRYKKGSIQIPEDLAQALGLMPTEQKSEEPIAPPSEPESEQKPAPEQESSETKTQFKRKRGN